MTPESVFGVLHLADRFALMLRTLAGKPLPQLPQAPGRRIVAPPIPTPEEDAAQQDAARICWGKRLGRTPGEANRGDMPAFATAR